MKSLKFNSQILEIEKINPNISKVLIKIAYPGLNRNNSYISKETFETAQYSLLRCPIVGEYIETIEDFGGHGGKLAITDDSIKWVTTTIPYGFIDVDSEITWQDVVEEDGTTREYLCATGHIWTGRYPELLDLVTNSKSHSMEIQIESGKYSEIDGAKCYEVSEFLFTALCILGDNVEPCFESSSVSAFSLDKDKFRSDFNSMMFELRDFKIMNTNTVKVVKTQIDLNEYECPHCNNIICEKELYYESSDSKWFHSPCIDKGEIQFLDGGSNKFRFENLMYKGEKNVNKKLELFAKFPNLNEDIVASLKANIEQFSLEELEMKLNELSNADNSTEQKESFSLTAQQLEQELRGELSKQQHIDRWGDSCRQFWYVDHDENRVYAEDGQNGYLPVGINYTLTGDTVNIDFDSKVRIKWVPQDMEDQKSTTISLMSIERSEADFTKESSKLNTEKSEVESKFNNIKAELETSKSEYSELKVQLSDIKEQFTEVSNKYASKIEKDNKERLSSLFNDFSKELTVEELESIKAEASISTYEEIEMKLFALVGKKKAKFSINEKPKHIDLTSENKKSTGKSYDELFEKYAK
ncbi:hypothetical protein IFU39_16830 [Paenibacillus sp. CFBP 13594]|uniref:hypothetical protein n=1 Tax=Paenibacillus sp. CFBP 13594 TaxID=2774037 RepID=UPI00177F9982|nr:hypothetical protein [Paenibacillus sp. CFBP 13594]MBD8839479.1 hypothetical protein [Paenibacillus sp. CFBP 13594]